MKILFKKIDKHLKLKLDVDELEFLLSKMEKIKDENLEELYTKAIKITSFNKMGALLELVEELGNRELTLKLEETNSIAKVMYDKFYDVANALGDYCHKNRNAIKNERAVFDSYHKTKAPGGTLAFNKQELYVLERIGGGEFLADLHRQPTSSLIIARIIKIINEGLRQKYNQKNKSLSLFSAIQRGNSHRLLTKGA